MIELGTTNERAEQRSSTCRWGRNFGTRYLLDSPSSSHRALKLAGSGSPQAQRVWTSRHYRVQTRVLDRVTVWNVSWGWIWYGTMSSSPEVRAAAGVKFRWHSSPRSGESVRVQLGDFRSESGGLRCSAMDEDVDFWNIFSILGNLQ